MPKLHIIHGSLKTMHLLSVNVSKPKLRRFKLKFFSSAFLKKPVSGSIVVNKENIKGDRQADLMNHGGLDKAVFGFSTNHYEHWKRQLNLDHVKFGKFGENLSITGLDESIIAIGDRLQINDCILEVSQPRIPCFKIGFIFKEVSMLNKFIAHGRTGVYFRVIQPGTIAADTEVTIIHKHPANVTVRDVFLAQYDSKFADKEKVMRAAVELPELAEAWKVKIADRLHMMDITNMRRK